MSKWQTVRLAEVVTPVQRAEPPKHGTAYRQIGVKLWGEGAYERETMDGSQTKYAQLFRAEAGDIIVNKIWARNGSVAVVPESLSGCFGSGEFPMFAPKRDRLESRWMHWLTKTPGFWAQCDEKSRGTSGKNRIKPEQFLSVEIPLPPLAEQRRVVASIEELAAKIREARTLRNQADLEAEALIASALSQSCSGKNAVESEAGESARQLLDRISKVKWPGHIEARARKPMALPPPPEVPNSWLIVTAGELQETGAILDIQDGNHGGDYPRKSEFGEEGVPFVTAKQFDNGTIRMSEAPRLPHERASQLRIGFAKANDVLLTHNASVGDVAVAPERAGDFLLGTSATYWRCNPEALNQRYLFYFMRSQHFQGQLKFIMKQTTRNQVSVLKQVNLWICFPPLADQRRIVSEMDALKSKLDELKRLQGESADELGALLPSILGRAFNGEFE